MVNCMVKHKIAERRPADVFHIRIDAVLLGVEVDRGYGPAVLIKQDLFCLCQQLITLCSDRQDLRFFYKLGVLITYSVAVVVAVSVREQLNLVNSSFWLQTRFA